MAAEIAAAGIIVSYWWPDVNQVLVALVFFAVLFTINAISVKAFGESEFLFSSIKVITVLVFLVVDERTLPVIIPADLSAATQSRVVLTFAPQILIFIFVFLLLFLQNINFNSNT